jgi:hypothetical protein
VGLIIAVVSLLHLPFDTQGDAWAAVPEIRAAWVDLNFIDDSEKGRKGRGF